MTHILCSVPISRFHVPCVRDFYLFYDIDTMQIVPNRDLYKKIFASGTWHIMLSHHVISARRSLLRPRADLLPPSVFLEPKNRIGYRDEIIISQKIRPVEHAV